MITIAILRNDGGVSFRQVMDDDCDINIEIEKYNNEPMALPAVKWKIIDPASIPADRTFRKAFTLDGSIDLSKAKEVTHEIRRSQRAKEFAPFDDIIAKKIPGVLEAEAEAARVDIRNKYAVIQIKVDTATSPEDLKACLKECGY